MSATNNHRRISVPLAIQAVAALAIIVICALFFVYLDESVVSARVASIVLVITAVVGNALIYYSGKAARQQFDPESDSWTTYNNIQTLAIAAGTVNTFGAVAKTIIAVTDLTAAQAWTIGVATVLVLLASARWLVLAYRWLTTDTPDSTYELIAQKSPQRAEELRAKRDERRVQYGFESFYASK